MFESLKGKGLGCSVLQVAGLPFRVSPTRRPEYIYIYRERDILDLNKILLSHNHIGVTSPRLTTNTHPSNDIVSL